ncbi:hypothetical protein Tco_0470819, partial [Tanacetum coccineum]
VRSTLGVQRREWSSGEGHSRIGELSRETKQGQPGSKTVGQGLRQSGSKTGSEQGLRQAQSRVRAGTAHLFDLQSQS